jgi:glycosyltransferase involved in cell wall biosynthesis
LAVTEDARPCGELPARIALVLPALTTGGVERSTFSLAAGLLARGLAVDLVVYKPEGQMRAELPAGIHVVPLRACSSLMARLQALAADPAGMGVLLRPVLAARRVPNAYRYLPALTEYLRTTRPAALITAFPFENLLGIAARRLAGSATRLIVTERNTTTRSTREGIKWKRRFLPPLLLRQYPMADAVVAVSDGVADGLAAATGLPRHRITTIYNPVVSQAMLAKAAEPAPHLWLEPGQPPVVMGLGRLVPQKDFPTLIRAFARVRAERPARLLIVGPGSGEAQAELRALAAALGCAEDTDLPGLTLNPFAYLARAGVFVLSSLHEGLPGVLIQALACGCPVVSTDCPSGPREILEGARFGRLVPMGDAAAIAEAVTATLDAPGDRALRIARAMEFSVDRSVDRYLALLAGTGLPTQTAAGREAGIAAAPEPVSR